MPIMSFRPAVFAWPLWMFALSVSAHAGEPSITPIIDRPVGASRLPATESTRHEADRAHEALSQELGAPADERVTAMKAARRLPDPSAFQPGDILWPRKGNQYIPYGTQPAGTFKTDKTEWEREKQQFLSRVKTDPKTSDYEQALASRLEGISFETFHERYVGDRGEGELSAQGWIPYVGHVAMVFFKDGAPWVVEAVPGKVRTIAYEEWLSTRGHEYVWHGRIRGLTAEQRVHMIAEAIRHESKPYDFWNFHLADEGGFYCSKLMWFALFRASGIAMDDDPEPRRFFWYSPKQMFKSQHIQILYSPGDYGTASADGSSPSQQPSGEPTFDAAAEGQSCEVTFSNCAKTCRTPDLERCLQSCCCRFGGRACPEAPNCCAQ